MAKAIIKLNNGTRIEIDGSAEEIKKILSLYSDVSNSISFDKRKPSTDSTPSPLHEKVQDALKIAKGQLEQSVQPCGVPQCKYNQQDTGTVACTKPTFPVEESEKAKGRHADNHAIWLFYCMRFVRTCYGAPPSGDAQRVYDNFVQKGIIKKDENIPIGAIVFWRWTTYGHVGICSSENQIIHTGLNSKEIGAREEPISYVSEKLGKDNYLGWAYPPESWLA